MKLLRVQSISKNFGGIKALDSCTLNAEKEKITAIIGPNGSGKTTLFNVIFSLVKEDKGEIYLGEENITKKEDYEIAKKGISRTFQEVRLFKNLTIRDHLEIALDNDDEMLLKSFIKGGHNNEGKIKEILELVGLNKNIDTYATDLSYGQRKLLDLAVSIAQPHELLMLDEPVAGINPKLREEIKEILKKIGRAHV